MHNIGSASWSLEAAANEVLFSEVGDDVIDYVLHGKADGLIRSGISIRRDHAFEDPTTFFHRPRSLSGPKVPSDLLRSPDALSVEPLPCWLEPLPVAGSMDITSR